MTDSLRKVAAGLALFSVLFAPASALAGTETLKRGFGNMVQGPVDIVLSPVTAGLVQYRNMTNIDDSTGVRIAYAVPGYFWLLGLTIGASCLRIVAGLLEFFPGIVLAFTDSEMDPLFAPSERGETMIWDYPTVVMDFRLGVDYTAAPF